MSHGSLVRWEAITSTTQQQKYCLLHSGTKHTEQFSFLSALRTSYPAFLFPQSVPTDKIKYRHREESKTDLETNLSWATAAYNFQ